MADNNPFGQFIQQPSAPSQYGLDLQKALIEQLGREHLGPKFEGPGGWYGHMLDAMNRVQQAGLINQGKNQFEQMAQNTGAAVGASRFGGTPSTPSMPLATGSLPPQTKLQNGPQLNPQAAPQPNEPPIPSEGVVKPQSSLNPSPVTPEFLKRVMMQESGGNPNSVNKYGYKGLYQFSKPEWDKWGNGKDIFDPTANTDAYTRKAQYEAQVLSQRLGRPITPGELYLAHQQGVEGAFMHLSNPDGLAWQNMLNTGEGQKKGEAWAKRAIGANVPPGMSYHSDQLTSGQFANYWTSKFKDLEQPAQAAQAGPPSPGAPQQPNAAPMHLGASVPADTQEQADVGAGGPRMQMAQGSAQPSQFAQPEGAGRGFSMPRLENREELQNLVTQLARMGMPPAQVQEVLKNYIDRSAGANLEGPGGITQITPRAGGAPPIQSQHPEFAKGFPLGIGELSAHFVPRYGDRGQMVGGTLMMPGGESKEFNGLDSANQAFSWLRDIHAQNEIAKSQAGAVGEDIKQAISQGESAPKSMRILDQLDSLNKNNKMPGGPTSEYILKARQFLENIAPGYIQPSTGDAEIFNKLNYFLASENAKSLGSRVTNFGLTAAQLANPNLGQSQEGRAMLIDLMRQELKIRQGLSGIASNLPTSQYRNWTSIIKDYYNEHHTIMHYPGQSPLHLKQYGSKEEMKKEVSPGERFLLQDGTPSNPR